MDSQDQSRSSARGGHFASVNLKRSHSMRHVNDLIFIESHSSPTATYEEDMVCFQILIFNSKILLCIFILQHVLFETPHDKCEYLVLVPRTSTPLFAFSKCIIPLLKTPSDKISCL